MKRHYLLAFSAGYFVANALSAAYISKIGNEHNNLRMNYQKLYDFSLTVMTVVEEKNSELMSDPRVSKFLFDDIVKRL